MRAPRSDSCHCLGDSEARANCHPLRRLCLAVARPPSGLQVAVKVILAEHAKNDVQVKLFLREGQYMSRCTHRCAGAGAGLWRAACGGAGWAGADWGGLGQWQALLPRSLRRHPRRHTPATTGGCGVRPLAVQGPTPHCKAAPSVRSCGWVDVGGCGLLWAGPGRQPNSPVHRQSIRRMHATSTRHSRTCISLSPAHPATDPNPETTCQT